jgi:hypothetical protein
MSDNKINEQERLATVGIFFEMYPELKKNKDDILMNVLEKYGKPIKYILTRFINDNEVYYIDPEGMIVDKDLNFKGLKYDNTFYFENINNKFINLEQYDKIMNFIPK